jgi:hypothetical protein
MWQHVLPVMAANSFVTWLKRLLTLRRLICHA